MLDMASHYQVVFPVADKNPLTLGVPECLRFDLGGEFESSFSELAEQLGCRLLPAASVSPTQNTPRQRAGGAWKYRARRLVDQFSIKWNDSSTKLWRCSVSNWSTNTAIGNSGHSPSQWVLGRSLRLLLSSCLVHHSQHLTNDIVMILLNRVVSPCWLKHRDRSSAPGTIRRSVMPSCPVPEVPTMLRHRFVLQSETRSCICVGTTSERVSGQCVGWAQGLSLTTRAVQTCGSVIGMPLSRQLETTLRLAEVEEQLPWHDLYDSLRETDEQTYFDLSPPGVSRHPQYGSPSKTSDVPMTPTPVPDESMQDVIADDPDTSEIPMLSNCVCTSAQSTSALAFRCCGTCYATSWFTTCCVFAKCSCSHTIMVSTSASHT